MVKFTGRYAPVDDSLLALAEANAPRAAPGREAGAGAPFAGAGAGPTALIRVDGPGELAFSGALAMRAGALRAALGGMDWGGQVRSAGAGPRVFGRHSALFDQLYLTGLTGWVRPVLDLGLTSACSDGV